LLAADSVVAASPDALLRFGAQRTAAVLNLDEAPTADFVTDRDATIPSTTLVESIRSRTRAGALHAIEASELCRAIFGDTVAVHTFMLGYAWQKGLVPVSMAALMEAIERNGVAIGLNKSAFQWGRVASEKPGHMEAALRASPATEPADEPIDALIARLRNELVAWQGRQPADRFSTLLEQVKKAATGVHANPDAFTRVVALAAFRVMAYKDEYEVARLYASPQFRQSLEREFDRTHKISIWLAPPILVRKDPATGRPKKIKFGSWILPVMKCIAALRVVRGTPLDVFGYTAERRAERDLATTFRADVGQLLINPSDRSLGQVEAIARAANEVRGFGAVKEAALHRYAIARAHILSGEAPVSTKRSAPVYIMKSI
jgi:indolepyruvate ferredoxin oxidoreductase